MAVISITVEETEEQIVAGFPRFISLSTNIPSNIFYTLNGQDPDNNSDIYTSPIKMPTDKSIVILKLYATNGIDSSSILSFEYKITKENNTRLPRVFTEGIGISNTNLQPFGSNYTGNDVVRYNTSIPAQQVIYDDTLPHPYIDGYNADGYGIAYANQPFNFVNYEIKYNKNDKNEYIGIGTIPGKVKIFRIPAPPQEDSTANLMFDPKSSVMYQDSTTENPKNPPIINSDDFTMNSTDAYNDKLKLFNVGQGGSTNTMQFVRQQHNPRTQMMTYYYRDTLTNRWLISTQPYKAKEFNITPITSSRRTGIGIIFQWINYKRTYLI